ncbi:MAG: prolyl oligopeptidase family serine peptidase [Oscillospiraceae bacterium]
MKQVEADHFAHYRCPSSLLEGETGALSFVVKQASLAKNRYDANLWVWQNGQARQLTFDGSIQRHWWQGGDIVFAALRTPKDKREAKKAPLTALHTISTTGPGEGREFLRLHYEISDIAFLPYAADFLFTAEYQPGREEGEGPAGAPAAAPETPAATVEVLTELPFWSNGAGFTSQKRQRLYLYQGEKVFPLVDAHTEVEQLRLSPSGNFAFFIARTYRAKAPFANHLLCLNLADLSVQNVDIAPGFHHACYAVLDDETLVVFGSDMRQYGLHQNGSFYRLHLPTGEKKLLYDSGEYEEGDSIIGDIKLAAEPRLFAEGTGVYWSSTCYGNTHLMRIDAETGRLERLTSQPGAVMEYTAQDGTLFYTALRGQNGPELYCLEDNGEETRLTALNTHLAEQYDFSVPRELRFINSEGVSIQGWVMPPANFSPEEAYPAVLLVHGGPKAAYGTVLNHEMQYLAARGFGVLYCNPTGSEGRGNEFADLRGRYGLIDYEDIMAFVDTALAENDWIDTARLGVAGGSYGGYMTNWIVGHTGRFAAACSQRGISNWVSMAATSDIGLYFVPDQLGATVWNGFDALWEQSPLKYADHVATPTLFLHSDQDYRCYMAESLQMYAALQLHNVPTRLCLFKGESHDLSRSGKPANRRRRLQEISDWFEKYLK